MANHLHEAAYTVEIFRAALDAIDPGQAEAAQALGMTPPVAMRVVLLPQAWRITIPPPGLSGPKETWCIYS